MAKLDTVVARLLSSHLEIQRDHLSMPRMGVPRTSKFRAGGILRAMKRSVTSIDGYLKGVPEDRRRALERLRKAIRSVIPEAHECISYRIPAFRVNGVVVAGFAATTKGCSYFPFSGSTLRTLGPLVSRYEQTKSSLHFSPEIPLPLTLVRKLIKTRMAEGKKSLAASRA